MQAIVELRDAGTAVLLVEEHAQNALEGRRHAGVHGTRKDRVDRPARGSRHGAARERLPRQRELTEHRSGDLLSPPASETARITLRWSTRSGSTERCSSIRLIDRDTVAAINREVDDAVAAAQPGAKTINDAIEAFFGPHTKHVSSLAAVSPTFANEVMTASDLSGLLRRDPPAPMLPVPAEPRSPHRAGARSRGADPAPRRGRVAALPAAPRRHPDRVDPRPRRLPRRERRDPRRAREPPMGARPPTRARRDRRRGGPGGWRRHLPRIHDPLRGHELDRGRVAARVAHQLHARLAAHRGEQRARRPAEDRQEPHPEAQALLGYAIHDAIADGGGYLGMVHMRDPMELLEAGELE